MFPLTLFIAFINKIIDQTHIGTKSPFQLLRYYQLLRCSFLANQIAVEIIQLKRQDKFELSLRPYNIILPNCISLLPKTILWLCMYRVSNNNDEKVVNNNTVLLIYSILNCSYICQSTYSNKRYATTGNVTGTTLGSVSKPVTTTMIIIKPNYISWLSRTTSTLWATIIWLYMLRASNYNDEKVVNNNNKPLMYSILYCSYICPNTIREVLHPKTYYTTNCLLYNITLLIVVMFVALKEIFFCISTPSDNSGDKIYTSEPNIVCIVSQQNKKQRK